MAAAALAVSAIGASEASAITVSNVQVEPASVQAGANSDLALSFDLSGGQLKDLVIHLPPGLVGNPLATPTCTEAQLNADACPPASDVGDISNDVLVNGLIPVTASGNVFNVVPRSGEPARFGFVLTTPGNLVPPVILQSPAVLRPGDFGLDTVLRDVPRTAGGLPITITGVDLDLKGLVGSPAQGFLRFPTSCGTNTLTIDATAYDASMGSGQDTFETVNCGALPFSPQFSAEIEQANASNQPVEVSTSIKQSIEEAGLKRAVVTLPADLGADTSIFVNACADADFQAGTCPEASVVGNARAASPLQAQPLTGPVILVAPSTPGTLPDIGLDLRGSLALKLKGRLALDASNPVALRGQVTFDNLPDIPISDFALTFRDGEGGLNIAGRSPCKPPPFRFDTSFLSHSGVTVDTGTDAKATCKEGVKRPRAKVRLKAPRTGDPVLRVSLKAGSARIRSAKLGLPKGVSLDLNRKKHVRGIDVKPGAVAGTAKIRSLRLKTKRNGVKRLSIRIGDGALVLATGRKPKQPFPIVVKDVGGTKTTLSARAK